MTIERESENWRDLENLTAKLFLEMGCKAEVEKEIETARGTTEIDVYVEDSTHTPLLIVICECKYWTKPIPKHVVHAFRTVAADCGASRGYIISKRDFKAAQLKLLRKAMSCWLAGFNFRKYFTIDGSDL